MSDRKCPYCGEYVPSNCLTCPKCFKDIPREEKKEQYIINDDHKDRVGVKKDKNILLILSTVPALIGVLGLGQIYLDPRQSRGYWFLIAGLILFLTLTVLLRTSLDEGGFTGMVLIGAFILFLLLYISAAVGAFIDAQMGSVFKILRF